MIIVLGMHRSGTSAVTRAIGLLGASMGPASQLRKHWENVVLREVNDRVLAAGGGSWDVPPPAGWLDEPAVLALRDDARAELTAQLGGSSPVVWKDPRTCLTLPFWRDLLDVEPVHLLIHRHPGEVAASLAARNSFGEGLGHALWERYNADALRAAAGATTVVLDYGQLLAEPVRALELVVEAFADAGVRLPGRAATTDHGLVAQERHHTVAGDQVLSAVATPSQHELFALLRALHGAHDPLVVPALQPTHPLSAELLGVAGELRRTRRSLRRLRNAQVQR